MPHFQKIAYLHNITENNYKIEQQKQKPEMKPAVLNAPFFPKLTYLQGIIEKPLQKQQKHTHTHDYTQAMLK